MSMTPYLTVKEAAEALGITDDGVRKIIRRGALRAIRKSERNTLIPRPAFEAYQRKLDGAMPPAFGRTVTTGDLAERIAAFGQETGQLPAQWLAAWAADGDADQDSATNMALAVSAVGLVAEQRARTAQQAQGQARVGVVG